MHSDIEVVSQLRRDAIKASPVMKQSLTPDETARVLAHLGAGTFVQECARHLLGPSCGWAFSGPLGNMTRRHYHGHALLVAYVLARRVMGTGFASDISVLWWALQ